MNVVTVWQNHRICRPSSLALRWSCGRQRRLLPSSTGRHSVIASTLCQH